MNGMLRKMTTEGPDIARQLRSVLDHMKTAVLRRPQHLQGCKPRLVAVSKTKPVSMILEAYAHGQRHFGENYVQELGDKAHDPEILKNCPDLKWHFIGHLQRNKVNKVTSSPGLYMVETVDSEKIAHALNNSWGKQSSTEPLAVLLQVNTSGEQNKNGIEPVNVGKLALYIQKKCVHLRLAGLMTIGAIQSSFSGEINPDFQCLRQCREVVVKTLGVDEQDLELSMGMSQDYESAIEAGSTNVRVGSIIFGSRQYHDSHSNPTASQPSTGISISSHPPKEPSGDATSSCSVKETIPADHISHLSLSST